MFKWFRKNLDLGCRLFTTDKSEFGTAGCIVQKDGVRHILTCRHVVADKDSAEPVESSRVHMMGHGGQSIDVGRVFEFGSSDSPQEDWALVRLEGDGAAISNRIPHIVGHLHPKPFALNELSIGMKVRKFGAMSKLTAGEISGISISLSEVNDEDSNVGMIQIVPFYDGQHRGEKYDRFCQKGDSGSLVVSCERPCRPVGLLQKRGTGVIGRGFAICLDEIAKNTSIHLD